MLVRRSAATTSSAADSGTSTREKRSAISIAPMSLPERYDWPVIAPTRSCGRTPAERPAPTPLVTAGGRPLVTWFGLSTVAAVVRRRHFDHGDLFLLARCSARLMGQLDRGKRHVEEVELRTERPDNSPEGIKVAVVFE